jgi:recombination protein RecA
VSDTFDYALFESSVKKLFGDEAITNVSKVSPFSDSSMYVPTSSPSLNEALGIGGIPRGRIIEIFGPEGGGKTTLALDIAKNAQIAMPKRPIAYIDVENTLNIEYAADMGLNLDKKHFILSQMTITEDVLEMAQQAAAANAGVIIVDSVPAMTLRKDMEEGMATDDRVAGNSKAIRSMLKRLNSTLNGTGGIAIFINHITYKVGVSYGNPETTPGGTGLKFYASVRLKVQPGEKIIDKVNTGQFIGQNTVVQVVKNKVAPPFRKAEYTVLFGMGIDQIGGLVDAAIENGVLTQKGAWVYFKDQKWNGKTSLMQALKDKPELLVEIREDYLAKKAA